MDRAIPIPSSDPVEIEFIEVPSDSDSDDEVVFLGVRSVFDEENVDGPFQTSKSRHDPNKNRQMLKSNPSRPHATAFHAQLSTPGAGPSGSSTRHTPRPPTGAPSFANRSSAPRKRAEPSTSSQQAPSPKRTKPTTEIQPVKPRAARHEQAIVSLQKRSMHLAELA